MALPGGLRKEAACAKTQAVFPLKIEKLDLPKKSVMSRRSGEDAVAAWFDDGDTPVSVGFS
jgi:hypothetical protein